MLAAPLLTIICRVGNKQWQQEPRRRMESTGDPRFLFEDTFHRIWVQITDILDEEKLSGKWKQSNRINHCHLDSS